MACIYKINGKTFNTTEEIQNYVSSDEFVSVLAKGNSGISKEIRNLILNKDEKTNEVREIEDGQNETKNEGIKSKGKNDGQKTNDVQNEEVTEGGVKAPDVSKGSGVGGDVKWNNTGTEFKDNKFLKDGQEFSIKHGWNRFNRDLSISVLDKNGEEVAVASFKQGADDKFYSEGSFNIDGSFTKKELRGKGLMKSVYDFVDKNYGEVKPSKNLTNDGLGFWESNKRKQSLPPQVTEGKPIAEQSKAGSESKSSEPSKSDKNYQEAQEVNAIVSKENPDASVLIQPKGEDLSLTAVYVGKEKRGKGIGSKVLESVKKQADKLGKKVVLDATNELDSETDLEKLDNFYKKNGFLKIGENKYEYDPKAKDSSGDIGSRTDDSGTKKSDIAAVTNKGQSDKNVDSAEEVAETSKPKPENVKAIEEAITKKSGTIKNEIIKEAANPTEVKKILDNLDAIKSKLAGLTTKDGDSVFSEECKWG